MEIHLVFLRIATGLIFKLCQKWYELSTNFFLSMKLWCLLLHLALILYQYLDYARNGSLLKKVLNSLFLNWPVLSWPVSELACFGTGLFLNWPVLNWPVLNWPVSELACFELARPVNWPVFSRPKFQAS